MPKSLRVSEKTNQGTLPQSLALESAKAEATALAVATDAQQGRGETGSGSTCPPQRHSSSSEGEGRSHAPRHVIASRVFVLDKHGRPLMPCHPARARKLLSSGRARVHHLAPFVIRLVDREVKNSKVSGVEVGIDPGSKFTGISVFRPSPKGRVGLVSIELEHRGYDIHCKMQRRANYRRRRRSANLRRRAPRFNNRTKPKGWLAPSLQHRVNSTVSIVNKLRKWSPVTVIHQELVRFNLRSENGELNRYEVREWLGAKYGWQCTYCGASDAPLQVDHIQPKSRGGSDQLSNLTLACVTCNQSKNSSNLREWLSTRLPPKKAKELADLALSRRTPSMRDAAAVNATKNALKRALEATGLPVHTGTGGRTSWNRSRFHVAKSHTLDALCVGQVNGVVSYPSSIIISKSRGRGTYARTVPDKHGFPYRYRGRTKRAFGYQTGDLVRAVVPSGKSAGIHQGRVSIGMRGYFTVDGATNIHYRYCRLLQRGDGYDWARKDEAS